MTTAILNLNDAGVKRRLIDRISVLKGKYRFDVAQYRERRSDNQNRFLFGVVYPAVCAGMKEAWGETMTPDECHIYCKAKFTSRPVVNRSTGQIEGYTFPTTRTMTTAEFAEYIEKIAAWAAEYLGVVIPEPDSTLTRN